nr:immunoglobulin heavy chain junction region [Macaca mulatta]MOV50186.1 immunoglobulin heavy chain junction region [Macaca mulatta]MOV50441.1 immunoglobulin heavy chain junction region [Macaca mulatta]MOV50732.1 immunoglobulin heavy chain junction region [Macaca mulatta]MOV50911.1 immunoglobulin heavy chain junction region [Macaca mulatta]
CVDGGIQQLFDHW